jgi:hypothetical protein
LLFDGSSNINIIGCKDGAMAVVMMWIRKKNNVGFQQKMLCLFVLIV